MYICNENVKILNELPMKKWKGKICVDNKLMVGMSLGVEYYGDIYSGIEIIEHTNGKNPKFKIKYNGNEFEIRCGNILSGRFGKILGTITNEFKIEIGQVFKDDKRDLVIIDRKYEKDKNGQNCKYYKYKCNKCGFECGEHYFNSNYREDHWIIESGLLKETGCACCCTPSRIVVLGINTIRDTDKWMMDFGISEEDAKSHTKGSNKKINVKCPYCKKEKNIVISDIYKDKSIGCICGDGKSYPEKFTASLLNQLKLDYTTELSKTTFKWCGNYRYDFYIPSFIMIIEAHGGQHYKYAGRGRTLQEEQENDKLKEQLALENGIDNYIIIDCRESDLEYIKNSILESKLKDILDLSKIDWLKCEEFALKNIVKEVCDYWSQKKEWESTKDLGKIFTLDRHTIREYLKKGTKLGWCNYDAKEESRKDHSKKGKLSGKKVEIFKDGISLGVFESATELSRQSEELFGVKLLQSNISLVCNSKYPNPQYKNFMFKYI